jgi:hypothetical protein
VTDYLNINGSCKTCDDFKHSDPLTLFRSCVADECNDGADFLLKWGYKDTCGAYFRPDNEECKYARECVTDPCNVATQIKLETGYCQDCGPFTKPDPTGKICVPVECDVGQILKDGAPPYCADCDPWTHPDSSGRTCITDPCNEVEKLLVTGTCETCPEYTHPVPPNDEGFSTDCMVDECALATQKITKTGTCETCPAYEHPDIENKNCI